MANFQQDNAATNLRNWLQTIDLSNADILQTERDIYTALSMGKAPPYWYSTPIAPLAEPVDLNALVGDFFNGANTQIEYHVGRLDAFYSNLSTTNNTIKSQLDSVEKQVTQATDDVQTISMVVAPTNASYYWISDTFNSNVFVDLVNSTALVDTDYGMAYLSPQSLLSITAFTPQIDLNVSSQTMLPGANLYIVNPAPAILNATATPNNQPDPAGEEPQPTLQSPATTNFGAIFDGDPSTWYEVERNFMPPSQKLIMQGRSFVMSQSGQTQNVQQITSNYDWTADISWPNGVTNVGPTGSGVSIVEWRDLSTENPVTWTASNQLGSVLGQNQVDPTIYFSYELDLTTPTAISSINILPLLRSDSSPITVEALTVTDQDSNVITVASGLFLGSNLSTTSLEAQILGRTGAQSVGSIFPVPTNRLISTVNVTLSSPPAPVTNGLAHIYQDVYTQESSTRTFLWIPSKDTWTQWARYAYNATPPTITTTVNNGLFGTISNVAQTLYTVGSVLKGTTVANAGGGTSTVGVLGGVGGLITTGVKSLLPSLGAVGTWLGAALPYLGVLVALDSILGAAFGYSHTSTFLQGIRGFDIFAGQRSAIAIRDMSLVQVVYSSSSVLQSVQRQFPGPVSKIGLFVDQTVPTEWGVGDWITYFISTDGSTWLPIPLMVDTTLDNSVTLATPSASVWFRAVFTGNSSDNLHTPSLAVYSLCGLPATT